MCSCSDKWHVVIKSDVKMWGILCGLFINVKKFKVGGRTDIFYNYNYWYLFASEKTSKQGKHQLLPEGIIFVP